MFNYNGLNDNLDEFDGGMDYNVTNYSTVLDDRVILLLDIDSFEVSIHTLPSMKGKLRVVANAKNRIVSVSHEAKQVGINREDTLHVNDAVSIYPKLIIIRQPSLPSGRPDTVVAKSHTEVIKAAIREGLSYKGLTEDRDFIFQYATDDEFYLDVTEYIDSLRGSARQFLRDEGSQLFKMKPAIYSNGLIGEPWIKYTRSKMEESFGDWGFGPHRMQETRLILGSIVASWIGEFVSTTTGHTCSIGVASNKLVAKIAAGLHKPESITVVSPLGFRNFCHQVPVKDVPGLGKDLGRMIQQVFDVQRIGHCHRITQYDLAEAIWTYIGNITSDGANEKAREMMYKIHGLCSEPVVHKEYHDSVTSVFKAPDIRPNLPRTSLLNYIKNVVCEEYAEKLRFEATREFGKRLASRVYFTITLVGRESETVTIGGQEVDVTGEQLYHSLLPEGASSSWPNYITVRQIKITCSDWTMV